MPDEIKEILIENAEMVFPNFSGTETPMNAAGSRNFCVILEPRMAEDLDRAGWNVKMLRSRDTDEPDRPYLQVAVGYDFRPPNIYMITDRGRTRLSEEMVGLLDDAVIIQVDMIIRGVPWARGGRSGIKAYVKSLYATIEEDFLQVKYAEIPEAGR